MVYFSYFDHCMSNMHHSLCSFFVWFQPKYFIYLLIELSQFRFILIYPQKSCTKISYIIFYIINRHHWEWTYVSTSKKGPLIIFLQNPYLATGSNLSWVELATAKLVAISREQGEIHQEKQLIKVVTTIPL